MQSGYKRPMVEGWTGRLGSALVGMFVPASCASCGGSLRKGGAGRLCHACTGTIQRVMEPWCGICGLPITHGGLGSGPVRCVDCRTGRSFAEARAYGVFEGQLRDLITRLKYSGDRSVADPLGHLILDAATEYLTLLDYEAIVPVPLHRDRLRERGFNQSFLLARPVASAARIPIVNALDRIVSTTAQVGLQGDARRSNVRGVFAMQPRRVPQVVRRNVLLVDDVMTTGATVDECAQVLKRAGALRVDAVVVARTP